MKRNITTIILLLISVISAFAQAKQAGFVKQYNEKLAKTPLGGVELNVYGASSTVSDDKGAFTLNFNTLKPGDKIGYSKIAKAGYVLFNKDKLDQWNISKDNKLFTIIMCQEEKFKEIKDNYYKVSSASYARQQQKEVAALEAEYKAGKKKEAEYRNELKEIQKYYQDQLKNIYTYVDKFSRIDLSELSAIEQSIIESVHNGDIEGAINTYEKQSYITKYEKEIAEVKELQKVKDELESLKYKKLLERDSLYGIIARQVDTYRLAGGKENFRKAEKLLKNVADADTTYGMAVWDYAYFADKQLQYLEAIKYYKMFCDTDGVNAVRKSIIKSFIADNYRKAGRLKEAYISIYSAIDDEQKYLKEHPEESYENLASILNVFGIIKSDSGENGEEDFKQSLNIYIDLYEKDPSDRSVLNGLAEVEGNLGNIYWKTERLDTAIVITEYAHKHFNTLSIPDTVAYTYELGYCENNLGLLYGDSKQYDKAVYWSNKAVERFWKQYNNNPDAWIESLAMAERNLGINYLDAGDINKASIHLDKAITLYEELFVSDSTAYRNDYAASLNNISNLKLAEKNYKSATSYAKFAYQVCPEKYNYIYSLRLLDEAKQYNLLHHEYKIAIDNLLLAIKYSPDKPLFYETLGDVLLLLRQEDAARTAWEELKKVDPNYTKDYPNSMLNKKFNR